MLMIRLSKIGRRGEAKFQVVVKEKRSKRDGDFVDMIGYIEKRIGKTIKNIDLEKLNHWKKQGAQISQSLENILK